MMFWGLSAMATLIEQLATTFLIGELTALSLITGYGMIGYAKVTAAQVQLQQTAKQSRYDAIINYGEIRSVAIYKDGLAECISGVCGTKVNFPLGVKVTSTFRGIDAEIAGKAGSEKATLISWSSETNAGIGGSFGQHGTITFSHPWTNTKFCLVRGGKTGNEGEVVIHKNNKCK